VTDRSLGFLRQWLGKVSADRFSSRWVELPRFQRLIRKREREKCVILIVVLWGDFVSVALFKIRMVNFNHILPLI